MWIDFLVGALQRAEIKHWRGFRGGAFGYNESPTSSCHTFCWKARRSSTCLFFGFGTALRAFTSLRDMSLHRNGFAVVSPASSRAAPFA
jgi:hypothetical protein